MCTRVHTSVHENYFSLHDTYGVHETGCGVHKIKLKTNSRFAYEVQNRNMCFYK